MTKMKKGRILAISVMLLVQLTSFGWPPTEAAYPASLGSGPASNLSNVQRKKRRSTKRRRSSRRQLARLNAALHVQELEVHVHGMRKLGLAVLEGAELGVLPRFGAAGARLTSCRIGH